MFNIALVATSALKEFSCHWLLVLVSHFVVSSTSASVYCLTWVLVSRREERQRTVWEQGKPKRTTAHTGSLVEKVCTGHNILFAFFPVSYQCLMGSVSRFGKP